eukprot:superscaffoldBa00000327_g3838
MSRLMTLAAGGSGEEPGSSGETATWQMKTHSECTVVESGELEACLMEIAGLYDHARGVQPLLKKERRPEILLVEVEWRLRRD